MREQVQESMPPHVLHAPINGALQTRFIADTSARQTQESHVMHLTAALCIFQMRFLKNRKFVTKKVEQEYLKSEVNPTIDSSRA